MYKIAENLELSHLNGSLLDLKYKGIRIAIFSKPEISKLIAKLQHVEKTISDKPNTDIIPYEGYSSISISLI